LLEMSILIKLFWHLKFY